MIDSIDEIPPENERYTANPEYKNFLMKILFWKTLIQTPIWWSCSGLIIWLMPLLLEGEHNPLVWIGSLILNYAITFGIIYIISFPIGRWYYGTLTRNFWWALGENVIYVHSGVLNHQLARIPFTRIQNLNTKSGWFDRRGGYSKVEIETAGRSGTYLSEGTIIGIKNPEEIIKKIAMKIKSVSNVTPQVYQDIDGTKDLKIMRTTDSSGSLESLESATVILNKIYKKLESIEELLKQK